jgi:hypothetical protein
VARLQDYRFLRFFGFLPINALVDLHVFPLGVVLPVGVGLGIDAFDLVVVVFDESVEFDDQEADLDAVDLLEVDAVRLKDQLLRELEIALQRQQNHSRPCLAVLSLEQLVNACEASLQEA